MYCNKQSILVFYRKDNVDIITLGWGSFFATVTFSIALVIWGRNGFLIAFILII